MERFNNLAKLQKRSVIVRTDENEEHEDEEKEEEEEGGDEDSTMYDVIKQRSRI
jgi:hypothetical protein